MTPQQFWWQHARIPLAGFVLIATLFATTAGDLRIAQALFFDTTHMRWIGADSWWLHDVVHNGGRWLIRGVVAAAIVLWIASYRERRLVGWRRPAAYFAVATVLSMGIVGLLKLVTNVDCPWDLVPFGGKFPFVELFADRPDALRAGGCFPAAHASSGYSLLALYFVFRERNASLAKAGLWLGIATGLVFGIAQQARGAHFVSHDLWSAFLVWMICLTTYVFAFDARLWRPRQERVSESLIAVAANSAASPRLAGD